MMPTEAEGIATRTSHIVSLACRVFGDAGKALRWLSNPKRAFHGATPIAMLDTEQGGREVEDMLLRIEHGMAA